MSRTIEEAKDDFKVGYLYDLKDFKYPFVWTGEHFESIVREMKAPHDARFDGDYYDEPVHIRDSEQYQRDHRYHVHDVYMPERFKSLMEP